VEPDSLRLGHEILRPISRPLLSKTEPLRLKNRLLELKNHLLISDEVTKGPCRTTPSDENAS
jgi:hypothetical protein